MFCRWKCPHRRASVRDRAIWAHTAVLVRRSRVSLLSIVMPAWRAVCGSTLPSFSSMPDKKETCHVS